MSSGILLTCFGPFGPFAENPSQHLLESFLQEDIWSQLPGLDSCVVGVGYDDVHQLMESRRSTPPAWAIHIGVATGASRMRLETLARNEASGADIHGVDPGGMEIVASASDLRTQVNLESLTTFAATHPEEVEVSEDAGAYLCNYLFYQSLYCWTLPHGGRSLFVHLADPVHCGSKAVSLERQVVLFGELLHMLLEGVDRRT